MIPVLIDWHITGGHKNVMPQLHVTLLVHVWVILITVPWVRAWMIAGTRWRVPGTAWSRTQQYNASIVMIYRFSVPVGPCIYSRYEFIAEELTLIDTYMYICKRWSQPNQFIYWIIHAVFSVYNYSVTV